MNIEQLLKKKVRRTFSIHELLEGIAFYGSPIGILHNNGAFDIIHFTHNEESEPVWENYKSILDFKEAVKTGKSELISHSPLFQNVDEDEFAFQKLRTIDKSITDVFHLIPTMKILN